MADQYEFTSDDPLRRPRPTGPDDEREEEGRRTPRRSPRRYDEEDDDPDHAFVRRKPSKSGTVTAIGIVAICLGVFGLLGNACGLGFVALKEPFTDLMRKAAKNNPGAQNADFQDLINNLDRMPIIWLGVTFGLNLLISAMLILSGVGTLHRKDSSRKILIVSAVANAALGIVGVIGNVIFMGMEQVSGVVGLIIPFVFAGFALSVLMSRDTLREFE
jgi:hypothetical protein